MTTEIAVINRLGIALAADSAVTISGFAATKIFDSGDKLFELSCNAPVAAMVNGNLHFQGVPWELFIKEFRDRTNDEPPDSIEGWGHQFLAFVTNHPAMSLAQQDAWLDALAHSTISSVRDGVIRTMISEDGSSAADQGGHAVLRQRTIEELTRRSAMLHRQPPVYSLRAVPEEEIRQIANAALDRVCSVIFDADLETDIREAFEEYVFLKLRHEIDIGGSTGLVVCGFAGGDLFPSLFAISIDGIIGANLRYSITHHVEISRSLDGPEGRSRELGTAISFAQTDVINRLLRGGDDRVVQWTRNFVSETVKSSIMNLFREFDLKVVSPVGAEVDVSNIAQLVAAVIDQGYEDHVQVMGDEIERPFKQTIALMPKQELIDLAEALVGITAVERKAQSDDMGTVGGPIDVALITRSEGFIWVKRKHYFNAELNPRYLSRLRRKQSAGEET